MFYIKKKTKKIKNFLIVFYVVLLTFLFLIISNRSLILSNLNLTTLSKVTLKPNKYVNAIDFLYYLGAFLSDLYALQKLNGFSGSFKLPVKRLSFGIFDTNLDEIKLDKFTSFNLNCTKQLKVCKDDKKVSYVFYNCDTFNITLNVFHKREKFLYVCGDNTSKLNSIWFGDVPRALQSFDLAELNVHDLSILIPNNLKKFLFDYSVSKFIECNCTLAKINAKKFNYTLNIRHMKNVITSLEYVINGLERFHKKYWLVGGSLLGFYRDCGVSPHATDIDIALLAEDYDTKIEEHFRGDWKTPLIMRFGFLNDSYELRLHDGYTQFDLFLAYNQNETHRWLPYHYRRKRFRQFTKKVNEFCSGDLGGIKVMVPCKPVSYLEDDYGATWSEPRKSHFTLMSLDSKEEVFSDYQWTYAVRFFKYNGNIDRQKTIDYLNEELNEFKLKELPRDHSDDSEHVDYPTLFHHFSLFS